MEGTAEYAEASPDTLDSKGVEAAGYGAEALLMDSLYTLSMSFFTRDFARLDSPPEGSSTADCIDDASWENRLATSFTIALNRSRVNLPAPSFCLYRGYSLAFTYSTTASDQLQLTFVVSTSHTSICEHTSSNDTFTYASRFRLPFAGTGRWREANEAITGKSCVT